MRKLFLLLVAFFVLSPVVAQAQGVPDYFLLQGRLVDANLDAHSGLYDFQISFWSSADANDADPENISGSLWSEQLSVTVNSQGFFEFKVGDATALPDPFSFDTLKYIQIDAKPTLESDYTILDPLSSNNQIDRRSLITIPYRSTAQNGFAELDGNGQISDTALPDSLNTTLTSHDSRLSTLESGHTAQQTQIDSMLTQISALQTQLDDFEAEYDGHDHPRSGGTPISVFLDGFGDVFEQIQLFDTQIRDIQNRLENNIANGETLPLILPDLSLKLDSVTNDVAKVEQHAHTLRNDENTYVKLRRHVGILEGSIAILQKHQTSDLISKDRIALLEKEYENLQAHVRLIETTPRVVNLENDLINAESILVAQGNSEDIVTLQSKISTLEAGLLDIAELHSELASIKTIIESNQARISALEEREATRTWKDPVASLNALNSLNASQQGEIRYVVDEKSLQVYDGEGWNGVGGSDAGSLKQNSYNFAQIIHIHTKREAQPGLFYWDRGNKQYFVGMKDGSIKSLFGDVPLPGFVQQDEWMDLRFVDIANRGFEKTKSLQYIKDSNLGLGLRSGRPNRWDQGMAIPELAFDRSEEKTVEYVFHSGNLDGRMMLGIADGDITSANELGSNGFKHQKFALYMQSGTLSNKIFGQTKEGKTWSRTYHKKSPWKKQTFYRVSFTVDKDGTIKDNLRVAEVEETNFDQVVETIIDHPVYDLAFTGERFMPLLLTHGNNSYRLAAVRVKAPNAQE